MRNFFATTLIALCGALLQACAAPPAPVALEHMQPADPGFAAALADGYRAQEYQQRQQRTAAR